MKTNTAWHKANRMPKKTTVAQRITWHLFHAKNCACRPIPKKLQEVMKKK